MLFFPPILSQLSQCFHLGVWKFIPYSEWERGESRRKRRHEICSCHLLAQVGGGLVAGGVRGEVPSTYFILSPLLGKLERGPDE